METMAMVHAIDADGKWLCRTGGVSAVALAAAYVAIIGLYIPMGAPPSGAEAHLAYVARNTNAWSAIVGLSVLTDLLFVPVGLALYVALQRVNRNVMLLATTCVALFILLDLAITWTNYAALIRLSGQYTHAVTETQRTAAIIAAEYPSAMLGSSLLFVYNTLVLGLGILMTGLVMVKGTFGKGAAYLGVATGALGIVSVIGPAIVKALGVTIIVTSVLTTIWLFLVGFKLYALGRQQQPSENAAPHGAAL
jgi:hypothetical protein